MPFVEQEAMPCVVCGAEAGTCGPHEDPGRILGADWLAMVERPVVTNHTTGLPKTVYVREHVWEEIPAPSGQGTLTVLAHNAGSYVDVVEAKRLGLPLVDAAGKPVPDDKSKREIETQTPTPAQRRGRKVETQDVKGPKRGRRRG